MNKIIELQGRASSAVKVIIATGLISMTMFGAPVNAGINMARAEDIRSEVSSITYNRDLSGLYASAGQQADKAPEAVTGAAPDTTNGGDSSSPTEARSMKASVIFSDMLDHWSEDAVGLAVAKGYVDGYPDGTFQPAKAVTRAEFIKLLVVATSGKQKETGVGEWYDPYVTAARANRLILDGDFPDGNYNVQMTRLELARAASRAIGKIAETDSGWLLHATSAGLMQGIDDSGTLAPEQITNRAQSVVIIERVLSVLAGKELEVSSPAVGNAELVELKTNIFSVWPEFFNGKNVEGQYGKPAKSLWDPSKMVLKGEVAGEPYEATLDELILVDFNNPNDPNYHLLQIPEGALWVYNQKPYTGQESTQYYALIPKMTVKKSKPGLVPPNLSIVGITDKDPLKKVTGLYTPKVSYDNEGNPYSSRDVLPFLLIPKVYGKTLESGILLRFEGPGITDSPLLYINLLKSIPVR